MNEESQELEATKSQVEGQPETAEGQAENSAIKEIGQLLGNQEEPVVGQSQEQSQEEPEQPVTEEPKEIGIIDDAMINEYPALKMYKGKPLKDLGKAYQNIVKAFTENQMRLKQIEKEKAKRSIPEPSEVPDPIEKPQEFKEYLQKFAETIKKQAVEEYLSQLREPQVDWMAEARKVVPEGVDFDSFKNDFMMFNAERFYNELGEIRPEVEAFYNANPQILINEMKKHYELISKANKSKETIKKESKQTAYNTIKTSLKKAQENKEDLSGAQFNPINRTEQLTQEDEILANIYKIAQGQ